MSDNTRLGTNVGTGDLMVSFEVTFSGDSGSKLQGVGIMGVQGTAEAWTANPIGGDATNGLDVDITRIAAGANKIGDVGIGTRTSGGPTSYRNIDLGATGVSIKGTAGQVYWIYCTNTRTTPVYLKLYNKNSAPTNGDTPVHTFVVPSAGAVTGAGFAITLPLGIPFASGIGIRATTGIADADNTSPSANECVVNLGYA